MAEAKFTLRLIDKVTGGAKSAGKGVDRILGKFAAVNRVGGAVSRGLGRLSSGFGAVGRASAGAASRGSMALGVLGGNLMTQAVGKVGELAVSAAGAAMDFITFGENSRLALGKLAKHGVDGEALFGHARAMAVRFGLDVMDTTKQYTKFLALQFSPAEAGKMIAMGADLQALGNSAEQVEGVFMALGQIKGKGRLQGEEMLQLAERGISTTLVQEEIGKILGGKTQSEVQKLMEAGKVDAVTGLQAIEQAINRKLGQSKVGESGAAFADTTITGLIGKMKARGQDLGIKVFDRLGPSINKVVGGAFDGLDKFFSSTKGQSFVDNLGKGFETFGTALVTAMPYVERFIGAFGEGFGDTWTAFGEGMQPILDALGGGDGSNAALAIGEIATNIGEVAAIALGAVAVLAGITGALFLLGHAAWTIGKAIVIGITEPLFKVIGDIIMWWDDVSAIFNSEGLSMGEKALAIGKSIVFGIARGIWSVISAPIDAIKHMAIGTIDALSGAFKEGSPSKVTRKTGRNAGLGLGGGLGDATSFVERAGARLAQAGISAMAFDTTNSDAMFGPLTSAATPLQGASTVQPRAGGGGVVVNLHVEVHGSSDPEETARLSARATRREIEAFYRQLEME